MPLLKIGSLYAARATAACHTAIEKQILSTGSKYQKRLLNTSAVHKIQSHKTVLEKEYTARVQG